MRIKCANFLLVFLLMFLPLTKIEAADNIITIVYEGTIYEINGVISEGVTVVSYDELLSIIYNDNNAFPNTQGREPDKNKQITVREFAFNNNLEVFWEEKIKTIVLTKNTKIDTITDDDLNLVSQLLSHDWFQSTCEEEVFNYFSNILTPELTLEVTEKVWKFMKEPTDWHWNYVPENLHPIDQGANYKVILATILEDEGTEVRKGYGLFTLKQQAIGEWLISGMMFHWP